MADNGTKHSALPWESHFVRIVCPIVLTVLIGWAVWCTASIDGVRVELAVLRRKVEAHDRFVESVRLRVVAIDARLRRVEAKIR